MTARQAKQRWDNKAGEKVAKAAGNPRGQDDLYEFLHAIMPRGERDPRRRNRRNKPFALL